MTDPRFTYVLHLADNAVILAQRLSQWCGHGPALEEDIALTNVALDLIGQARMWYAYASELDAEGRDEDQLAFLRDTRAFRNALLVEQPNGSYADTVVRQFYFDAWHGVLLQRLMCSSDARIAAIAAKAEKEARYHLRRSSELVVRLGDGTAHSHALMQAAVDDLWMYTGELFMPDEVDRAMHDMGVAPDLPSLKAPWLACVGEVLQEATLTMPPETAWMQNGGKQGLHTECLGYLLAEMQHLQRAHPGARW